MGFASQVQALLSADAAVLKAVPEGALSIVVSAELTVLMPIAEFVNIAAELIKQERAHKQVERPTCTSSCCNVNAPCCLGFLCVMASSSFASLLAIDFGGLMPRLVRAYVRACLSCSLRRKA